MEALSRVAPQTFHQPTNQPTNHDSSHEMFHKHFDTFVIAEKETKGNDAPVLTEVTFLRDL